MGSDGLMGCRTIREHGGSVLVQDQASSTIWGMPGVVANAGLAHKVIPLNDLAPEILRITSRIPAAQGQACELLKSVV
jgi:two-component system chemotaxis response regulator CheB